MNDTHSPLSENDAVTLLTRWFRQAGFNISNNVHVSFGNVEVNLDGWDAQRLVGFEYLSSEHNDHADLTLAEYEQLIKAHHARQYHILVIDESEALTHDELRQHADEFFQSLPKPKRQKRETARDLQNRLEQLEARVRLLEQLSPPPENLPGYQPDRRLDLPTIPQRPTVICERARHSC
jgi:hypothetical protein